MGMGLFERAAATDEILDVTRRNPPRQACCSKLSLYFVAFNFVVIFYTKPFMTR
jgi:hypothetical protein